MTDTGTTRTIRLDGFHAIKHALRFKASIISVHTDRYDRTLELAQELAPDTVDWLRNNLRVTDAKAMRELTDELHPTRVVGFAVAPPAQAVPTTRATPAVLLEDPKHFGNVGAVIRVAAGLGASALIVTGETDPWRPAAIRGSAGLHFALPIIGPIAIETLTPLAPSLVAVDPDGDSLEKTAIEADAVLCFGTEREGLSEALLAKCSARVRLPMRTGVSSLNLATSVSATLFYLATGPLRSVFPLE